ncbi:MAG: M15 family metallopeptidase [Lachnospiraceae bacterium]|nr:M15 family metallopeptidase [Lachnospiraceae bacterium]
MLNKQIPTIKFPSIREYSIIDENEKIISISNAGIKCNSQYYKEGIPGSYKDCYARESVVEKLVNVNKSLPNGFKLLVYDAYRPICIQQRLWNYYRQNIKNNNPKLNDEELDFKTSFFVSKPSYDEFKPSLHNTGGAVDLTILGPDGKELNMGTKFDDFSDKAWTNHFEEFTEDTEVRDNRRLLYWSMINAGFTNLPSEWWHYDYGDKFWAFFNKTNAKYRGIIDIEFDNRFPLS